MVRSVVGFAELAVFVGHAGILHFLCLHLHDEISQDIDQYPAMNTGGCRRQFLVFAYVLADDLDQSGFNFALGNFRYEIQSRPVADN